MSQDHQDKHNALEEFLKDNLDDDDTDGFSIPDQAIKKTKISPPIETDDIEITAQEAPKQKIRPDLALI